MCEEKIYTITLLQADYYRSESSIYNGLMYLTRSEIPPNSVVTKQFSLGYIT